MSDEAEEISTDLNDASVAIASAVDDAAATGDALAKGARSAATRASASAAGQASASAAAPSSAPSSAPNPSAPSSAAASSSAPSSAATSSSVSTPTPRFPLWAYKVAIIFATVLWGASFFILKDAIDVLPPSLVIAIRFLSCGLLMTILFHRRLKEHFTRTDITYGLILGLLEGAGFIVQTIGLAGTTPGKNAFITAVYCVIVPFVWWIVARRRPTAFNVVAGLVCVVGIGLVSIAPGTLFGPDAGFTGLGSLMSRGDALSLASAFIYAAHIVAVAKLSPGRDIFVLTTYQFWFSGALALIVSLCTETVPADFVLTGELVFQLLYLIIGASLVALLIQNISLQYVPPAQASLLLCLESVFGVLFSVIFYGERVTPRLLAGFATIFVAVLLSEGGPLFKERRAAKRSHA